MPKGIMRMLRTILIPWICLPALIQAAEPPSEPSAAHLQRAEKITGSLKLAESTQATRVRDLIARQYSDLSGIHATRDTAIKEANKSAEAISMARDSAAARVREIHYAFLAALSTDLSAEQVEQVKDGMTYGVAPLTFRVYQEMLPTLSEEQKRQLLAWLREAREHAMDAGSSEEKHACFGKYKGRINNYLAAAGIDMKKAEREMTERKK